MGQSISHYETPDEILVSLINETIEGSEARRAAARFILDCIRQGRADDLPACIDELEEALLDVAADAKRLARDLGLFPA